MASNNVLLGHSGAPVTVSKVGRPRNKVLFPTWRYHKDFPARVFKTEEEVKKAEAEGWVDSPAKVNLPPPVPAEEEKQPEAPVIEPLPELASPGIFVAEVKKEQMPTIVLAPTFFTQEGEPQPEVIPAMPVTQPEEKPDGRALLVTCPECGKEYKKSYMNLHIANAHKKKG